MTQVHVLAFQGCTPLAPVGFVSLLRKAGEMAQKMGEARSSPLDIHLVSGGRHRTVQAASGLTLSCDLTIADVRRSDLVLIPPLDDTPLLKLEANRAVVPWIKKMFAGGADLASACTGTFVLAEAGLLRGRSVTTHWTQQDALQTRYPQVRIDRKAIIVEQRRICTAGGATSFLDLVVRLVERFYGPRVGRLCARMFLIERSKAPQTAHETFQPQLGHGDEQILRAQHLISQGLRSAPSVGELAKATAMSRRNFIRRFKQATGSAPLNYIRRLRVEAAKQALEKPTGSVGEIARQVGYGDAVAFRKLFVRATGLTPRDYRKRFGIGVKTALP